MEQHENSAFGAKEFAAAHPELVDGAADYIAENPDAFSSGLVKKAEAHKAKRKYEGLFTCPASDGNFTRAIHKLSVDDLETFKAELITRDLDEHCHKGRIDAVAKEIRRRGSASAEIFAVENMAEDIVTADNQFGDGMPYELERIENEIRFYQAQTGTAFMEMGKRLIRIKAHEGHGKFIESLNRLGMTVRPAQYMMLAARKFSNTNSNSHLEPTKLRALSVLDEDDIKILESGGEVRGMTLDDIDRMTSRELRENLRKDREQVKKEKEGRKKDRTAFEQSMLQKDAKINELDMRLSGQEPPTKEQIAQIALVKMTPEYSIAIARVNGAIREAHALVAEAEKIEGIDAQRLSEWLNQFSPDMQTFHDLAGTWTDEIDNAAPIKDWRISDLPGGEEPA
jgi:hypothetical protein